MTDFEKKYLLAKSRAERLKKSARQSEVLLEQRSRDLYLANKELAAAHEHLQQEIKQATYELNVANQRLRKSLKEKSQLIGSISHEVRTPLNAIVGYSELMESELPEGEIKDQVNIISQSATSMMSLLNDILEITQIEVGDIRSSPSNISMQENHAFINRMFKLQMQEKGLEWKVTQDELPEFLRLDVRRYNQIINNLISNALKYTDRGHVHMHSWFEVNDINPQQGMLFTSISDTGEGISEEDQLIIFDVYKQTFQPRGISLKGAKRQFQDDITLRSLGLGLPICKTLCKLLLGEITCESELNKGSTFIVKLPVSIVSQSTNKGLISIGDKSIENTQILPTLKILIAEDTLLNQQVIQSQLAQLNQTADIVDNGLLALSKLNHNDYDVVILDILMPIMDGETTIRKIRDAEPRIAQHYCVALTAASYQEKGRHLLDMGFNHFASKPLTLNALIELLQTVKPKRQESGIESQISIDKQEVLDFDFFKQQFGEDADAIFQKIAPTYVKQSKLQLQKLHTSIEEKDLKKVQFIAHTMKGEAKTFGFTTLGDVLHQLEGNTDLVDIGQLFKTVSEKLDSVLESIQQRIKQSK